MKKLLTLLMTFIFIVALPQDKNSKSIDKIFESTPQGRLPFATNKINYDHTILLDKKLVISGILNNDSSKLEYFFDYYDIDNGENIRKSRLYKYRSVVKYKIGNIQMLVIKRGGNNISQITLMTYINSQPVDSLKIGYSEGDTEIIKYTEGEIKEDYTICTKACVWNPEYSDEKLKENPDFPRSVVTLSKYKINQTTGKISLLNSEKKYSKCIPEEFSYKNSNCELVNQ